MRRKERGIALLITLLILTILIVLIAQMSISSRNTSTISENYLFDLQNSYGNRSGYNQARLYLEADTEKDSEVDSLGEKWASEISFTLGKANISVSTEDSERRINLSQINNDDDESSLNEPIADQFRQLLLVLGHPSDIAERVIDYIDTDSKGDYEFGTKNDRLYTMEELLQIEGLPSEALYGGRLGGNIVEGFLDFVTIYPRNPEEGEKVGKININTAPSAVLQSLSKNITPSLAEAIHQYRSQQNTDESFQSFESTADIKNVDGMTDEIFAEISDRIRVNSSHFEIRVRSTYRSLTKNWLYVIKRETEGEGEEATESLELVFSQKTSDFLAIPPPEGEEED